MTKLIFLNGPPYSGKDTAAKLLKNLTPSSRRISFADRLKKMFCLAHNLPSFPEGPEKDKPLPAPLQDKTWREGVIAFSELYMKPLFGKDIFGKLLLEEIKDFPPDSIFAITDSGFSEEGKVLVNHYGRKACCVVQMHRPGRTFLGDSRSYITAEDIGADFTIYLHNTGSLDFLQSELHPLAKWTITP